MLIFVLFSAGWPKKTANNSTVNSNTVSGSWPIYLDLVIAVKCGFDGKRGKKPKKAMKPRGRKGSKKAMGRRDVETFAVCSNAQMTFSPAVSIIFYLTDYSVKLNY